MPKSLWEYTKSALPFSSVIKLVHIDSSLYNMTDSLAIGLLLPSTNLTVNLILSFKFTLLVVFYHLHTH